LPLGIVPRPSVTPATAVLRSVDGVRALKSETGGNIVTAGSIKLVRELIAAGLVDEYRLFT
jgi:dihydrofolate reductase